jgi:osmotically-inducible protein OsmY
MKPIIAVLSLSAAMACAQQPATPGQNPPPSPPPTTVPESSQQPTPTPQAPRQDKASVNSQIQDNIRSALSGDPVLSGTDVQASVDDVNITLTGFVESQGQFQRVLQLVSPYGNYRQVVNKVEIR